MTVAALSKTSQLERILHVDLVMHTFDRPQESDRAHKESRRIQFQNNDRSGDKATTGIDMKVFRCEDDTQLNHSDDI